MTVYKGCPYCERVFEIGPEDDEPMRRHIVRRHDDELLHLQAVSPNEVEATETELLTNNAD